MKKNSRLIISKGLIRFGYIACNLYNYLSLLLDYITVRLLLESHGEFDVACWQHDSPGNQGRKRELRQLVTSPTCGDVSIKIDGMYHEHLAAIRNKSIA